jgi:hypothetical protein
MMISGALRINQLYRSRALKVHIDVEEVGDIGDTLGET